MLVLSRRVGERIIIDDHVILTVLDVWGSVVRLGIEAPREVVVHRAEIHARIAAGECPRKTPKTPGFS